MKLRAQIDKEFWFVAPEVSQNHGDKPIILRFNTLNEAASITVSQPANASFAPIVINISANSSDSIDLTPYILAVENTPANTVLNYGIHIVSSSLITAIYEVAPTNNAEIFSLKGKNALGTTFYTPFQLNYDNGNVDWYGNTTFSTIDIVATEDNTSITIVPTKDAVNHPANVPFTIILNKGQTYSIQALSTLGPDHLSGTKITSTKPIAVTIKDDSIKNTDCLAIGNYDLIGEQLVSVNAIKDEYILIKGQIQNSEKVYIVAVQDTTSIYVNGSFIPVATINAGQTYVLNLADSSTYINTTGKNGMYAPVYLLQLSGFDCEFASSCTPPIICTGSKETSFVRTTNERIYLNITVVAGYESSFLLNGVAGIIKATDFKTVKGSDGNWKFAHIDLSSQIEKGKGYIVKNENTEFHLGILQGDANQGARFVYASSFNDIKLELGGPYRVCPGEDSLKLDAGPGFLLYGWNTGSEKQFIYVKNPGDYSVSVINKAECVLGDTVHTYCEILKTEDQIIIEPETVKVFPNPIDKGENLNIFIGEYSEGSKECEISMYDMQGAQVLKFIKQLSSLNENIISIRVNENLQNGLYFLKLSSDKKTQTFKILVR